MKATRSGALVCEYLNALMNEMRTTDSKDLFDRLYGSGNHKDGPFLSIVTRTQGKRPQALMEILLCLTAQTNMDFEVLIMGHNLTVEQQKTVEQILSDLPDDMRSRTTLYPVDGGTRTTPLTVGFDRAKGQYISILDDDDIVFDDWVQSFYECSMQKPGALLHAYAVSQMWEAQHGNGGINSLSAVGSPDTEAYCHDFEFLKQLIINRCPTMSYACPSYAYKQLGIRFDESLTTTEDWDFLMRTAFITGVQDIQNITSIYRLWIGAENSQMLHDKEEWDENYRRITDKFVKMPLLLPANEVARYMHTNAQEGVCYTDGAYLYYAKENEALSEEHRILGESNNGNSYSHIRFYNLEEYGPLCQLRFDPMEFGFIKIKELKFTLLFADGTFRKYNMFDLVSNGIRYRPERPQNEISGEPEEFLLFLKSDPQFLLQFEKPLLLKEIRCDMMSFEGLTDAEVDAVIEHQMQMHKSTWRKKLVGCRLGQFLLRIYHKLF